MKLDHNLALTDTSLFAHSDTVFSALVNAFSSYADGAEDFIQRFGPHDGSIKISSLFYYLQNNEERVYFLPKPVFLDIESPKTVDGNHKKRNLIKFVSLGTWLNGFEPEKWFDEKNASYHTLQSTFVMTNKEHENLGSPALDHIAKTVLSPKSPKRGLEDQAIYYQADVEIGSSDELTIGIYFMYEAEGQAETELKIATNIMAYTGIGGEIKNTGRTVRSQPEFDILDFGPMFTESKFVCVSLLNPSDATEFSKVIYYSTSLRGGRLLGTGKEGAKVVRMIEEGALLFSNALKGRMVDLGLDEHDRTIYRLGIPFLIPVNYGN
ncbi:MAG: hypothetical protein WAT21_07190 [Saprospiraceae bacterium]